MAVRRRRRHTVHAYWHIVPAIHNGKRASPTAPRRPHRQGAGARPFLRTRATACYLNPLRARCDRCRTATGRDPWCVGFEPSCRATVASRPPGSSTSLSRSPTPPHGLPGRWARLPGHARTRPVEADRRRQARRRWTYRGRLRRAPPSANQFGAVYAQWTRQNHPSRPGRYRLQSRARLGQPPCANRGYRLQIHADHIEATGPPRRRCPRHNRRPFRVELTHPSHAPSHVPARVIPAVTRSRLLELGGARPERSWPTRGRLARCGRPPWAALGAQRRPALRGRPPLRHGQPRSPGAGTASVRSRSTGRHGCGSRPCAPPCASEQSSGRPSSSSAGRTRSAGRPTEDARRHLRDAADGREARGNRVVRRHRPVPARTAERTRRAGARRRGGVRTAAMPFETARLTIDGRRRAPRSSSSPAAPRPGTPIGSTRCAACRSATAPRSTGGASAPDRT